MPCTKTQQANLSACSPPPPLNIEHQAGKLRMLFFKVCCYDSTRGMIEVGTSANQSTNPQIRKLRTQVFICGFANLISYRKYLRICGKKSKFTANPQTYRQCCLIRGKTARKKWTLLFSGLEGNDRELMTFSFFFLEVNIWWMTKFDLQK